MQLNNNVRATIPVLVRAWGDEPVKLYLHRIENNIVFVGSPEAKRPIGLPVNQVFPYKESAFALLSTVFQQDKSKLSEEWANADLEDFSCNKYQDNIDSQHD